MTKVAEGNGKDLNTKATVAGGGAGTLVIVLADQISSSNETLSTILTYAAPAISVGSAAAWVLLAVVVKAWRSRYIADAALKRARSMRDEICADPGATQEHKVKVREKVEHFERLSIAIIQAEFESIEIKLQP